MGEAEPHPTPWFWFKFKKERFFKYILFGMVFLLEGEDNLTKNIITFLWSIRSFIVKENHTSSARSFATDKKLYIIGYYFRWILLHDTWALKIAVKTRRYWDWPYGQKLYIVNWNLTETGRIIFLGLFCFPGTCP